MSQDNHDEPPKGVPTMTSGAMILHPLAADESLDSATAQAERLLGRLRSVDFVPYESMTAKDAVPHLRSGPIAEVRHALDSTLKLLRVLSRITGAQADFSDPDQIAKLRPLAQTSESEPHREGVPRPMHDDYVETMEAWLAGDGISLGGAQGPEGPAQVRTMARMLETMAAHVAGAQAFVTERMTHSSKWGLIAAGEEGRRKARRTVRAAILLVTRLMQPVRGHKPLTHRSDPLSEALTSRELLMRARADLLALVDVGLAASDSDIGPHMREVRMRFVQLLGAQGYGDLRVADRHAMGVTLSEVNGWLAKPWNDFNAARQILAHVAQTAEGLASINLRGAVLKHDRATQMQALAMLDALGPDIAAAPVSTPSKAPAKATKPRPTAQQKRFTAAATLVGTMRWRSAELQQFFDSLSDEAVAAGDLPLNQVGPLSQMLRRAMS
jgi:hypothetical protein